MGMETTGGGYRDYDGKRLSSVGIGTYLGEADDDTDGMYREAIERGIELGCNVVDTAINYRHQRSEVVVGEAVENASAERDEVFVSTKGGYIPFRFEYPEDPNEYVKREFVEPGIVEPEGIVEGNCITPDFIEDQLERSLENLGFDYIDLYYVHNPETQLSRFTQGEFYDRLLDVFELLEEKAEEGLIDGYGLATWDAFRVGEENPKHLSMSEIVEVSEEASQNVGETGDSKLKAVQMPYNERMDEAYAYDTQTFDDQDMSAIEAAQELGLFVFSSASIMQGQLTRETSLEMDKEGYTETQKSIEFARSVPGMGTSLVGTKSKEHVDENLELLEREPLSEEEYRKVFESR